MHACMHVGSRVRGIMCAGRSARESHHAPVDIHFPFTLHADCPTKIQQCKRFLVNMPVLYDKVHNRDVWYILYSEALYLSAGYIAYICSLDWPSIDDGNHNTRMLPYLSLNPHEMAPCGFRINHIDARIYIFLRSLANSVRSLVMGGDVGRLNWT